MNKHMDIIVARDFGKMFSFKKKTERIEYDAILLQYYFLSEFELAMERRNMTKAQLAKKLKCSPSWLTQMWRGDKRMSLVMAAKIAYTLGITLSITSHSIK